MNNALSTLRAGGAAIICDDENREGEGDLAFAAIHATHDLVNLALTIARGLLCVSMWPEDAVRIGLKRLPSNQRDIFSTPFGSPVGIADGSSGISVEDRTATIRKIADTESRPEDFVYPGHVSTLIAQPGGVLQRDGHTEAVLDLLRLAGVPGPGVLCEILTPEGSIAKRPFLDELSRRRGLPIVEIRQLVEVLSPRRKAGS